MHNIYKNGTYLNKTSMLSKIKLNQEKLSYTFSLSKTIFTVTVSFHVISQYCFTVTSINAVFLFNHVQKIVKKNIKLNLIFYSFSSCFGFF